MIKSSSHTHQLIEEKMLLDRHDTSSLNQLIAKQIGCNSSKIKAQTILCRSISRESIKYDLVDSTFKIIKNKNDNFSNITRWHNDDVSSRLLRQNSIEQTIPSSSKVSTTTSPVYHIFYSTEYSDSIIYIMAILAIYFILFSLLIYANWTSFHNRRHSNRRSISSGHQRRRRRHKQHQDDEEQEENQFYLIPELNHQQHSATIVQMTQSNFSEISTNNSITIIPSCLQNFIKNSLETIKIKSNLSTTTTAKTKTTTANLLNSIEMDQFISL